MLGGFTQSGTSTPYKTSGNPDIMARLTFEVLKEEETYLDWEYIQIMVFLIPIL